MTADFPAVNTGWMAVLAEHDLRVEDIRPFGPMGFSAHISTAYGDEGSLLVTQADDDGVEWLHVSIAFPDRNPSYLELVAVHRAIFGRGRWAVQVFAPEDQHVNLHEHALHLFGKVDGKPVLPDFTRGTGSI